MNFIEKTISQKNIYQGKVVSLDLHDVELTNGKISEREVIRHQGGVCILPITREGKVYLVKQYRKPFECEIFEAPAGKLEKNEAPEACAVRELKEETGLKASKLTFLTQMYPTPGYSNEIIYIYKAEELEQGDMQLDEDEFMDVYQYTLDEAFEFIKIGVIKDAKTIIAILLCYQDKKI